MHGLYNRSLQRFLATTYGDQTWAGLHYRRALQQAMHRLIDRAVPFALINLDLDWFKAVNDSYGHAAGDAVLRHVAKALRDGTRRGDTVARVGEMNSCCC